MFPLGVLRKKAIQSADPNLTKLLLNFEGSNGSTTFTDESPSAHPITIGAGSPVISTAQKPFGASSLYTSSGAYLQTDESIDFAMSGLQVFTLECSVFATAFNSAESPLSTRIAGVYCPIEIRGDGTIFIGNAALDSWYGTSYGSGVSLIANTWNHIRVVADGVNIKVYVNGINNNPFPVAQPNWPAAARRLYIGRGGDGSFDGYIKGVRFINEVMNTGNFTPPTAPFAY
jgi:hypothetical protein